jgi:hypothetical protein
LAFQQKAFHHTFSIACVLPILNRKFESPSYLVWIRNVFTVSGFPWATAIWRHQQPFFIQRLTRCHRDQDLATVVRDVTLDRTPEEMLLQAQALSSSSWPTHPSAKSPFATLFSNVQGAHEVDTPRFGSTILLFAHAHALRQLTTTCATSDRNESTLSAVECGGGFTAKQPFLTAACRTQCIAGHDEPCLNYHDDGQQFCCEQCYD